MSQQFNKIAVGTGTRSTFDLSHNQVTTTDFGKIIPICVRECLPNDDFTVNPRVFIRLAPLAAPTFGRIKARVHTFFVPNRIMWNHWDDWISNNYDGSLPYFTIQQLFNALSYDPASDVYSGTPSENDYPRGRVLSLLSNLGFNPTIIHNEYQNEPGQKINAFPMLAYQRIWFDYFRDSMLSGFSESWYRSFVHGGSLDSLVNQLCVLRYACFKKDYFTTARIDPQQGSTGAAAGVNYYRSTDAATTTAAGIYGSSAVGSRNLDLQLTNSSGISVTSSVQVNALRAANSLQRYLERNNYVGARTLSRLLARFGIAPSAERLDMAEYLGSNDFDIMVQDVTSTAATDSGSGSPFSTIGLGSQAGKGIGSNNSKEIHYHCKEHGILMSVLSIMPDTGYYQGLHKMWQRGFMGDNQFEYFTPEFENLGYRPILNREVYVPAAYDNSYSNYLPQGVFGFSPTYSEYKFQMDVLGGDFVSRDTSSASDSYHLFRNMHFSNDSPLRLENNFITLFPFLVDYDRIFQVTDNKLDHFYCDIFCDVKAIRNMSSFTEPSLDVNNSEDGKKISVPYGGIRL